MPFGWLKWRPWGGPARKLRRAVGELEQARAELAIVRASRGALSDEVARVTAELAAARRNVRNLVPAFSAAKPDSRSAGFLRLALRAWIGWFNECPGVIPFRDMVAADVDVEMRLTLACEAYARAIMESAAAAHLDGANPRSDRLVLAQLIDCLGADFARQVRERVSLAGVVFDDEAEAEKPAQPEPEPEPEPSAVH